MGLSEKLLGVLLRERKVREFIRARPFLSCFIVLGLLILLTWVGGRAVRSNISISSEQQSGGFTGINKGTILTNPPPRFIRVQIAEGTLTTVTDAFVKSSTSVQCGCEGVETSAVSCNEGGRWMARPGHVRRVSDGTFEIVHSYASGNEVVVCRLDAR